MTTIVATKSHLWWRLLKVVTESFFFFWHQRWLLVATFKSRHWNFSFCAKFSLITHISYKFWQRFFLSLVATIVAAERLLLVATLLVVTKTFSDILSLATLIATRVVNKESLVATFRPFRHRKSIFLLGVYWCPHVTWSQTISCYNRVMFPILIVNSENIKNIS